MKTLCVIWGSWLVGWLSALGRSSLFLLESLVCCLTPPIKGGRIVKQLWFIGWKSLPVIFLTSLFAGMVLGFQGVQVLRMVGSDAFVGPLVALSMLRELGPVLAALMITGRAGSSITAEIGIMRTNDQIDALELMGLNPLRYLVAPNVIAMLIAVPLLTAMFDLVAIGGGWIAAVHVMGMNASTYFGEMQNTVIFRDIWLYMLKAMSFGGIIAWVCCYKGYTSRFGAEGVSAATTQAVVNASVLVLVWNYLFTSLFA